MMDSDEVEAEVTRLADDIQDFDAELDRVAALADSIDEEVDELPEDWP